MYAVVRLHVTNRLLANDVQPFVETIERLLKDRNGTVSFAVWSGPFSEAYLQASTTRRSI